jgi:hypothetical protein
MIPKEGEHIAYGWDLKPFIAKNESPESQISIQSIVNHQDKDHEERMLVDIMCYMEDLMWENKFNIVDNFIEDFCKEDICFQYCLCLLTCAYWAKDNIKNKQMLIDKTKAQGIKEIGEKDTLSCLKGLI